MLVLLAEQARRDQSARTSQKWLCDGIQSVSALSDYPSCNLSAIFRALIVLVIVFACTSARTPMSEHDAVEKLIAEIYEGVDDPARWRSAVGRLVSLTGARFAYYGVIDSAAQAMLATGIVGEESSRLDDATALHGELMHIDPGLTYALARPEGGVFCFANTNKALTNDPKGWRDFIRHDTGSGDYHSRFSTEEGGLSLVLSLHSFQDQPTLTPEQAQLHAKVFDHFQRAMRLAYRTPDLRLTREAMVMVDGKGLIRDASALAEAILSENHGLVVSQGRLRAVNPAQDSMLQSHIREVCNGGGARAVQHFIVSSKSDGPGFLLRLGPVPLRCLGMEGEIHRCLVEILGAAQEQAIAPDSLRSLFGLTMREAEISALLAVSFNDLRSVANHLGISHETARVHARSIYSKIGVSNQVELVRVLSRIR